MEGEDRGLHAEAEETQKKARIEQRLVPGGKAPVQAAAALEGQASVAGKDHHAHKGQGRAAHGIEQVLEARGLGHAVHLMHDQGQGAEGQQLIEEIEGEEIGRQGDAQHHAIGHGEEGEEAVLGVVVLHVLEGVEVRHRPEDGDDGHKHGAQAVQPQGQGEVLPEDGGDEEEGLRPGEEPEHQQRKGQQRRKGAEAEHIDIAAVGFFRRADQEPQAAQKGQEDQDRNQNMHVVLPPFKGCRKRFRRASPAAVWGRGPAAAPRRPGRSAEA